MPAELLAQHRHQPLGHHDRGRDQRAAPLELVDDLVPHARQVEVLRSREDLPGDGGRTHPVDPEGAPSGRGAGHQVPGAVLVDQPPGLRAPPPRSAAAAGVVELHHLPRDDGVGEDGHLRTAARPFTPPGRVHDDRLGGGLRVRAEGPRQRAQQLAQRRPRGGRRRGRRAEQEEQRPRLRGGQARQVGAGAAQQLPPAAPAGLRVDGDAGGREGLQVAPRRGHRHLQLGGELGGGDPAAERLVPPGATVLQPPTERGAGSATAVVADPFGNLLGVVTNPHWQAAHGG